MLSRHHGAQDNFVENWHIAPLRQISRVHVQFSLTRVPREHQRWPSMQQRNASNVPESVNTLPRLNDYSQLIRKLRWIGMDEEAETLQQALRSLPPEQRSTVSAGPFSTD